MAQGGGAHPGELREARSTDSEPARRDRGALSEEHHAEVVAGSGVDPGLLEGRYRTVTAEEARALGFSEKQAKPGWVVELSSPTGEISYQLKPDDPRSEIKNGKPKVIKYETRCGYTTTIDVNPRMRERALFSGEPLWVVEGAKKGDCLATRNRPAVVLTGVWNWGKKRKRAGAAKYGRPYGRPELLPDWEVIPLEGRRVHICFDADFRKKRGVALSIMRLAERLTERGAHVYIVWLPAGPQKGIDDFVVAGGDLEQLEKDATPYQACDLTPYAAKDSEAIRRVVGASERRALHDSWARKPDRTARSLLRTHHEIALERGVETKQGYVEYVISRRELQSRSEIGSPNTLARADANLQERGYIDKESGDPKNGKANRYRLIPPKVNHYMEEEALPRLSRRPGSLLEGYAPHLRWPGPPPPDDAPHGYGGSKLPHLGKTVELILDLLCLWGTSATMQDLAEASGVGDTTRLRSRYLEELDELGIVELPEKGTRGEKAVVRLTGEWRRRLDERREMGGELSASRRQAAKHRRDREGFCSPPESADREPPPPMDREKWESVLQARREDDERARIEEQRRKVGVTAEVFVHDRLAELGKIRFGLLKEVWGDDGGDPRHIWAAVRRLGCRMQRLPEYDNRLFVFPPERSKGAPDGTSKEARGEEIVQHHGDATLLGPF